MPRLARVIAALALLGSGGAAAEGPGYVDLFFVPKSDIEFPVFGIEDDGNGFGIRGMAPVGGLLAVTGGYQGMSYDGGDVADVRFGFGLAGETGSGIFLEYAMLDVDITKLDGFALRGRLASPSSNRAGFYGEVGWLQLGDDEFDEDWAGLEFTLGATFPLGRGNAMFVDVRQATVELEEDSDIELVDLTDFRAGVRLGF